MANKTRRKRSKAAKTSPRSERGEAAVVEAPETVDGDSVDGANAEGDEEPAEPEPSEGPRKKAPPTVAELVDALGGGREDEAAQAEDPDGEDAPEGAAAGHGKGKGKRKAKAKAKAKTQTQTGGETTPDEGADAQTPDEDGTDAADAAPDGAATEAETEDGPAPEVALVDRLPLDPADDLSEVEGDADPRLVSIVESLLFAASKPLGVKRMRKVLGESTQRQVQLALKALIGREGDHGIVVKQVAGGFVMRTAERNAEWVQRFLQAKPVRLSRPQLETLAVIAYRQPITRAEIDHVRGVDSGAVLKLLLEKELIQIAGRKEEPGRPMLYGTTVGFLEFFNLMSLRDLPDLREFRELSSETKQDLEKKMGASEVEQLGQEVLDFAARSEGEGPSEDGEIADEAERTAGEDPNEAERTAGEVPNEDEASSEDANEDEASSDDADEDEAASDDANEDEAASEDESSEPAREGDGGDGDEGEDR